jgi:hypothetical protein
MKNIIFITIFFLFATQIFAQESIDSIIKTKTKELRLDQIKDFFYFENYCIGSIKIVDTNKIDCSLDHSNLYVFWKKDNKSYVEKIDQCENPKIEIDNKILDFYFKNVTVIKNENVEIYAIGVDSIIKNKRYKHVKMVSHSCYTEFYFYVNSMLVQKKFDEFNLTTEREEPNINYKQNNELKLVQLGKLCDEIIKLKGIQIK